MAICILIAGRSLALRKRYSFVLVMACIECLFIPFGTILGVFTIVVLSRESVRGLFSTRNCGKRLAEIVDRKTRNKSQAGVNHGDGKLLRCLGSVRAVGATGSTSSPGCGRA